MALKFPYIIAEAGTGHHASVERAHELIDRAWEAGADAIKFQMFVPNERLFCPVEGDSKRFGRWNETALTFDEWRQVKYGCSDNIDFLASVFQPTGIEWLKKLKPVAYKVASRAAKTYPYDQVPGPFIISAGMGLPPWIEHPAKQQSHVLCCRSQYPTLLSEARWRDCFSGLSDHSGTPWPAIDALARGAKIIEVHVGDKEGPDAAVNLTFDQLKLICEFRDALAEMREG